VEELELVGGLGLNLEEVDRDLVVEDLVVEVDGLDLGVEGFESYFDFCPGVCDFVPVIDCFRVFPPLDVGLGADCSDGSGGTAGKGRAGWGEDLVEGGSALIRSPLLDSSSAACPAIELASLEVLSVL
jgi:hypothetical protein